MRPIELTDPYVEAGARALAATEHGSGWWDDATKDDRWRYLTLARCVLRAAAVPLDVRAEVDLVETVARATHAHNNSGTDPRWRKPPITWESEQPYLREWHRKMARAALDALSAAPAPDSASRS